MLSHLVKEMPTRLIILSQYSNSQRAYAPAELFKLIQPMLRSNQQAAIATTAQAALDTAIQAVHPGETLSILGSVFFSAEIRELISR